jgi:DNA-binding CsgD family transcriptional regulator
VTPGGVVYSTIAGIPAVTHHVPAVIMTTANSFSLGNRARMIPLSLPRLKFLYGDVADTPAPLPAKPPVEPAKTVIEVKANPIHERDAELVKMRLSGMTFAEIGRAKGVTADRVRKAVFRANKRALRNQGCHRYIMPPCKLTPLQERALELKNSGMTVSQVAVAMQRTTNAVSKLLAQAREKMGFTR